MPKIRSHSGAKKRFIVTKSGKVKHKKRGQRHLMAGMPSDKGLHRKHSAILEKVDVKIIKKFMPYSF